MLDSLELKRYRIREDLTLLMSECYSKEGSSCKLHPVFQPQKFLNKLFPYLDKTDWPKKAIPRSKSMQRGIPNVS